MAGQPRPLPHEPHAKKEPARLFEVAQWVHRSLAHELLTGIGGFLNNYTRDFRGIAGIADSFTIDDIPDDPLRCGLVLKLHSGQQYRITIEEM